MQTVKSPNDLAALFGLPLETATAAPVAPVAFAAFPAFDLPKPPKPPTKKRATTKSKPAPVIIRATVTPAAAPVAAPAAPAVPLPAGLKAEHKLSTVELIKQFIFGGNAIFTLANKDKGTHYTYHVSKKKGEELYFVSVLSGPNNTADYSYIGCTRNKNGVKIFTKRDARTYTDNAPCVQAFNWLLNRIAYCITESKPFPAFAGFYHMGNCCKCNRPLTDPLSVELGIGPVCRAA